MEQGGNRLKASLSALQRGLGDKSATSDLKAENVVAPWSCLCLDVCISNLGASSEGEKDRVCQLLWLCERSKSCKQVFRFDLAYTF